MSACIFLIVSTIMSFSGLPLLQLDRIGVDELWRLR